MKVSEVTEQNIKDYLRIDYSEDDTIINAILVAAKIFVKNYTGLTEEVMDTKEDLTMAVMVLANELYSNKQYTVENDKLNVVVKSIMDMNRINLQ